MSPKPFKPGTFKANAVELSGLQNTCSAEQMPIGSLPDIPELPDKPSSINPCNGINENVIREAEWRLV